MPQIVCKMLENVKENRLLNVFLGKIYRALVI